MLDPKTPRVGLHILSLPAHGVYRSDLFLSSVILKRIHVRICLVELPGSAPLCVLPSMAYQGGDVRTEAMFGSCSEQRAWDGLTGRGLIGGCGRKQHLLGAEERKWSHDGITAEVSYGPVAVVSSWMSLQGCPWIRTSTPESCAC